MRQQSHCPVCSVTEAWGNEKKGNQQREDPCICIFSSCDWGGGSSRRRIRKYGKFLKRVVQKPPGDGWSCHGLKLHCSIKSSLHSIFPPWSCPSRRHSLLHILHTKLPRSVCTRKLHLQQEATGFFWAASAMMWLPVNWLGLKRSKRSKAETFIRSLLLGVCRVWDPLL